MRNAALMGLLDTLDQEEATLSKQRRLLHERIDQLQASNGETPDLVALQQEDRALSERRLLLHQQITELRLERNRRLAGLRAGLHAVQ